MTCPHCGRGHDGHERTPGAFSAVCDKCQGQEAAAKNGERDPEEKRGGRAPKKNPQVK